jgi:predicted nucleic acid-binding protein
MRIVADASVLLSAVLGGRAGLVLNHPRVEEILTTETAFAEVQEYAPYLAQRKRLSLDTLLLAVSTLPVTVVGPEVYAAKMREAERRIGRRDPNDVDLLALALHLHALVWSNDNDFEEAGVEWYTTAELLRKLGPARAAE